MAVVRAIKVSSSGGYSQIPDADQIRAGSFGGATTAALLNGGGDSLTMTGGSAQLSSGVGLSSAGGSATITGFDSATFTTKVVTPEVESSGNLVFDANSGSATTITFQNAGAGALSGSFDGNLTITGDLTVQGTQFISDTGNVQVEDNHLYLNKGYEAVSAETGGLVVNYLPTATNDTVDTGGFTAGVDATSDPTVATVGAATFSAGDLVQVEGAADPANDGLYEVQGHASNVLTIRSTQFGVTDQVEDFTDNQFVTDATVQGTIRKVTVSVLRAGTDGAWEQGSGSTTGISFSDLATAAGVTLQSAYETGNTIILTDTDGDLTITLDDAGTAADFALLDSGGDYLRTDATNNSLDLGSSANAVDFVGSSVVMTGNPTVNAGTGQWDFGGNVDANAGLDVSGGALTSAAGTTHSGGELLVSGGNMQLNDNITLSVGTGDDLSIVHNATDTVITSATGDLIIDNTNATGSTIVRLGTNTSATDFQVQGDDGTARFTVTGATSSATFDVDLNVNGVLSLSGGNLNVETVSIESNGATETWTLTADTQTGTDIKGVNISLIAGTGSATNGDGGDFTIDGGAEQGTGAPGDLVLAPTNTDQVNLGGARTGNVDVLFTTDCSDPTTGALTVSGGVGIALGLCVGGAASLDGDVIAGDAATDTFTLNANIAAGNNLNWHNGGAVVIGFDQAANEVAGDALTTNGGQGGDSAGVAAGGVGGAVAVNGGQGGDGDATFAAGAGADVSITGGGSGLDNGGGGANGGDVNIAGGAATGAGTPGVINLNSDTNITGDFLPNTDQTHTIGSASFGFVTIALEVADGGTTVLLNQKSGLGGVAAIGVNNTFTNLVGDDMGAILTSIDDQLDTGDTPWNTVSNVVNLDTSTDNVTIGSATNLAKLGVDGDTDEVQLLAQANGTQTNDIFVVETSAGTDIFAVSLTEINADQTIVASDGITLSGGDLAVTGGGNITFQDSANGDDKVIFGAGSDMQLYSDGTDGFIEAGNATADIRVKLGEAAGATGFFIQDSADQVQHSLLSSGVATWTDGTDTMVYDPSVGGGELQLTGSVPSVVLNNTGSTKKVELAMNGDNFQVNEDTVAVRFSVDIGTGDTTVSGDLAVNGTAITSTSSTFSVLDTGVTTVNAFGAATIVDIGGPTGTTTVKNDLSVDGTATVTGQTDLNGPVNLGDASGDTITVVGQFDSNLVPNADDSFSLGSLSAAFQETYTKATLNNDLLTGGATSISNEDAVMVDTAGALLGQPADAAAANFTNYVGVSNAAVGVSSTIPLAISGVASFSLGTGKTITAGQFASVESTAGGGVAGKVEEAGAHSTLVSGDTLQVVCVALQDQITPGGSFLGLIVHRAPTTVA